MALLEHDAEDDEQVEIDAGEMNMVQHIDEIISLDLCLSQAPWVAAEVSKSREMRKCSSKGMKGPSRRFAYGDVEARGDHYGGCHAAIGGAFGSVPPMPKMRLPN